MLVGFALGPAQAGRACWGARNSAFGARPLVPALATTASSAMLLVPAVLLADQSRCAAGALQKKSSFAERRHFTPVFMLGLSLRQTRMPQMSCLGVANSGPSLRTMSSGAAVGNSFEELLMAGSRELQNNHLEQAVALLRRACATDCGQRSSFALGTFCNALIWSGSRAEADRVAKDAVSRGVWDSPIQRPLSYTLDLPTAPFPDPVALGYPEVREAMDMIEAAIVSDLRAIQDDVNICLEANEAPEGLQDPLAGSWQYTKINFSGLKPDPPVALRTNIWHSVLTPIVSSQV